jgi:seryl-tRNA synthetase
MLPLKYITENTEELIVRLAKKHFDGAAIVAQVVELDGLRKSTQTQLDNSAAEMNNLSKEIGLLFKQGKQAEAANAKEKTTELKENIKLLDEKLSEIELKLNELLVQIPNLPHESVPVGKQCRR